MTTMECFEKYIAVKFEDGSHEVVPKMWMSHNLDIDKYFCLYPNGKKSVKELAKAIAEPKPKWRKYEAEILIDSSTYAGAEQKLKSGGYIKETEEQHLVQNDAEQLPISLASGSEAAGTQSSNMEKIMCSPCSDPDSIMNRKLDSMIEEQSTAYKILTALYKDSPAVSRITPATNLEELNVLAERSELEDYLILTCKGNCLRHTARNMLKSVLSPELAAEMSYSGLDNKKQKTKIAFGTHNANRIIINALGKAGYDEDRKAKTLVIQEILRNCKALVSPKSAITESVPPVGKSNASPDLENTLQKVAKTGDEADLNDD